MFDDGPLVDLIVVVFWSTPLLAAICFFTGRRNWRVGLAVTTWLLIIVASIVIMLPYANETVPPHIDWISTAMFFVTCGLSVFLILELRRPKKSDELTEE